MQSPLLPTSVKEALACELGTREANRHLMRGLDETQEQTFQVFPFDYQVLKCLLQESKAKCFNYVSITKILNSWTEASGSVITWQSV